MKKVLLLTIFISFSNFIYADMHLLKCNTAIQKASKQCIEKALNTLGKKAKNIDEKNKTLLDVWKNYKK
tara:strand:+ start:394 stop:600 length:207 start_codon:yes stop_codon:yes gene_type:complete